MSTVSICDSAALPNHAVRARRTRFAPRTWGLVTLAAVWAGALAGCGNSAGHSRMGARDEATSLRCNWEQMCGHIGAESGKLYTSMDNCTTQVRANWDSSWSESACEGKINEAQLRVCLDTIVAGSCDDEVGLALNLVLNCNQGKVCTGS